MATALEEKLAQLRGQGVSAALCAKLGELVQTAPSAALAKLVPPRVAAEWHRDPNEVLEAFLHATRLGLFDLEWAVRCPSCTGPTQAEARLDRLHSRSACPYCEIDFTGGFDESVEVTWKVHPAIRDVSDASLPEVLAGHFRPEPLLAIHAEPGQALEGEVVLRPGNYQLVVPAHLLAKGYRVHPAGSAVGSLEVVWNGQEIRRDDWQIGAGRYAVRFRNESSSPVDALLARVTDEPWVSAAELASCQSFRDMFSSELIRPNDDFAIRSVHFVFTDIKGSTALYERVGDSRAFALVRDHFEIMIELVHQHRGAIVKTIGDAIMATFLSPAAALSFALDVHQRFDDFNRSQAIPDAIVVKVGVHHGPCIAVNLNERIDYFGRTVNTAARIQGLSEGGDVVISESFAKSPEVQELVRAAGWSRAAFTAKLKGIEGDAALLRIAPPT